VIGLFGLAVLVIVTARHTPLGQLRS